MIFVLKNTNLSSSQRCVKLSQKGFFSMETNGMFQRYAIIKTGGKQYQALEGKTIAVEKLDAVEGSTVIFDEVLLRRLDKDTVEIGQPFLDTPVKASVIKHAREPKVIVYKWKRRKKYRRKLGHRQSFTVVRIESI
ncbi:MAG: 50S ribosomal protein L21 [candidate division TM6 bacterium GW2011_GWE2_41_16]|jgi:large subunit ribosomal protein L21|nr:MAG: 50S ribosomal protein L21 [candidate division TM6 bacterium GW2011_GWE2_41_16]